ncbi:hypothetical protein GF324_01840 [bacterium]|nr:hypothetical protein [bacterium]
MHMDNWIGLLQEVPLWYWTMVSGLIGAIVGSFLNVVIYRVPRSMSILKPSSHCPSCGTPIRPWNNIPLLSYILLRGRCSSCGAGFSIRYWVVEALGATVAVWSVARYGISWEALAGALLGWHLIALAFIDIETMTVPDHVVLPMALGGLLTSLAEGGWNGLGLSLLSAAIGAVFILLILVLARWMYRKEGIGLGDLTTVAGYGTYMQPMLMPVSLLFAAVAGLAGSGVWMVVKRRDLRSIPIPFVPALAVGAWFTYLYGSDVVVFYLSLFLSDF